MNGFMRARARVTSAAIAVAAVAALVPGRALAATTTCEPVSRSPITIGVAGDPVATTPGVFVEVCVTVPSPEVTGTPAVRVEDYNCCSLVLTHYFGVFIDSGVSSPPSTVSVSVNYTIDGVSDSKTVSVPVGGLSGSSTCVFYRGTPANNPGGCLVFLEE